MEDGTGTHDERCFDDFDEDLTTLLYLLIVLICVLTGESAYWCLYVVLLLSVADMLCNWQPKTECLVPGSALHPKTF